MLLACPSCSSAFRVPPTAIEAEGRAVRCSACQYVWTAVPAELIPEPELETAIADTAPFGASSLTGDSRLDAEIEAAFAEADRAVETTTEIDDLIAIDRPLESEMMIEEMDAPPLAPDQDPFRADAFAEEPPADALSAIAPEASAMEGETSDLAAAPQDDDAPRSGGKGGDDVGTSPVADSAQAVRPRRRPLAEKPSPWRRALNIATTLVVMAVAAVFIWRADLVRLAPNLAGFYEMFGLTVNLRGLELHEVSAVRDLKAGVPVLTVEGYVFNPGPKAAEVPKLRMAVLGANGREVYAWTAEPAQPMLAAGESFMFRSRLASPPQDGQDVLSVFC
jgi:predicted Zn finger-like uncharacterized protein